VKGALVQVADRSADGSFPTDTNIQLYKTLAYATLMYDVWYLVLMQGYFEDIKGMYVLIKHVTSSAYFLFPDPINTGNTRQELVQV
jgi:hypothetical protein